jgi:hypothetical protein
MKIKFLFSARTASSESSNNTLKTATPAVGVPAVGVAAVSALPPSGATSSSTITPQSKLLT